STGLRADSNGAGTRRYSRWCWDDLRSWTENCLCITVPLAARPPPLPSAAGVQLGTATLSMDTGGLVEGVNLTETNTPHGTVLGNV
ncbi:MAG: hypothetical protein Q7R41_15745, partial [Phycisphaerales bacterium]|nr:hypothetical protein [Phycisphaerales bacterium]